MKTRKENPMQFEADRGALSCGSERPMTAPEGKHAEHTPTLPWRVAKHAEGYSYVYDGTTEAGADDGLSNVGREVAVCYVDNDGLRAELIAESVNSHAALVAENERLRAALMLCRSAIHHALQRDCVTDPDSVMDLSVASAEARAALAGKGAQS